MKSQERQRIKNYFDEFIFGFIFNDIQSAICGKANFLAALGLLCYTEFVGGLVRGEFKKGDSAKNFNTFFDYLGKKYRKFRNKNDVYDIYRCGMAHEYFIKKDFTIYMFEGDKPSIGVGKNRKGRYYFIVESYFRDFKKTCQKFYNQLQRENTPPILKVVK